MSKFYTAKDLEKMVAEGTCLGTLPADAKFTPMARDILRKHKVKPGSVARPTSAGGSSSVKIHSPVLPDYVYNWKPGGDPKTAAALEKFFYSPEIQVLKERMCNIGRRIWGKGYSDGNGGNITIRVGDNMVLCTPTMISKGFMTPEDICMVDMDANQIAGTRPRTSEVKTHLGIMKHEPAAKSCVHAHPIYATAYAVAGVRPPACIIPEPEVFLGEIGLAEYDTPGTPEVADAVGRLAIKHQSILMLNHGVICWGKDVEDAYWKMENTDAYCQTATIAMQIGGPKQYSHGKLKELIDIRKKMGMPDYRLDELKECELCDADQYTMNSAPKEESCGCSVPQSGGGEVDEALVRQITDMIVKELS